MNDELINEESEVGFFCLIRHVGPTSLGSLIVYFILFVRVLFIVEYDQYFFLYASCR